MERLETAPTRTRYIPASPVLAPWDLLRGGRRRATSHPFDARWSRWYYRASNAIYHLTKALELGPGDVVLAPDWHSGNEIWAMRAAGARIVYYPIRRNREPDLAVLERLCRVHRPRVLYVIHFMGWPQPMDALLSLPRGRDTVIIEDCALALYAHYRGRPVGTFGDYAVYCPYKTLPMPNGGFLVENRRPLRALDAVDLTPCDATTLAARTSELVLEWTRARVDAVGAALDALKRRFGRALTSMGVERVQVGNIGFDPTKAGVAVSPFSRRIAMHADAGAVRERRRENYRYLQAHLPSRIQLAEPELGDDACPLFMPVIVRDKRLAADALRARGVTPVEFWNYGDPEAQRLGSPDAQYLRDRVLGLPIHQDLTHAQLDYVAAQMADIQAVC